MSADLALGLSPAGLVVVPELGGLANPEAAAAFLRLRARGLQAGWHLEIASGYRNFHRQLAIFNAKAGGQRNVLDDQGLVLERSSLIREQWLHAILRFSALPGTSRHHWGTDFDIWDSHAGGPDYKPRLEASEYGSGGVFDGMTRWLDDLLERDDAEGFFRPYARDHGGVAPEPWHISFRPAADQLRQYIRPARLKGLWQNPPADPDGQAVEPLLFQDLVIDQIESLLERYVVS